ncbi:hypothetical protein CDAR_379331 [Caerostris darwini]|uniref:Uncharacterized protein n=1 Tax=Caerostris darwini TaxID=1538125 RepID=A0AAV4V9M8_9ARAC|nr:hypothetical protein CDAR_379331 [Caerostris darwini]
MTCPGHPRTEKGEGGVSTKCPVPEKNLTPPHQYSSFSSIGAYRFAAIRNKRYNRQPTTASLPSRNAPRHPTHRHIGQSCVLSRCVLFLPSNVTM